MAATTSEGDSDVPSRSIRPSRIATVAPPSVVPTCAVEPLPSANPAMPEPATVCTLLPLLGSSSLICRQERRRASGNREVLLSVRNQVCFIIEKADAPSCFVALLLHCAAQHTSTHYSTQNTTLRVIMHCAGSSLCLESGNVNHWIVMGITLWLYESVSSSRPSGRLSTASGCCRRT